MKLRVGWLSPYSSLTGVGTFTHALTPHFNASHNGVDFEFTLLVPQSQKLYQSCVNAIQLPDSLECAAFLDLFDFLVFNLGNNAQHHDLIHRFLLKKTGVAICHDYVYQHYFAGRAIGGVGSVQNYGALIAGCYESEGLDILEKSGVASVRLPTLYAPWETIRGTEQPLAGPLVQLASGLIVHSQFSERYVSRHFDGPMLRLGFPCDQKPGFDKDNRQGWRSDVLRTPFVRALSFGHLTANKSIDVFIEAISRSDLLRTRIRYTIAGHPSDRAYTDHLLSLVEEYGLRNVVTIEFSVPESRLMEMMRDTDFFVNLRYPNTEAASASLAEQMYSGKPSLIYATGCYAEVPCGASIRIEQPGDLEEIIDALEAVVRDRKLLISKGDAAREHASKMDTRIYVDRVKSFLLENGKIFERRRRVANNLGNNGRGDDASWLKKLRAAREKQQLLDEKWLPVATFMDLSGRDAARYFALVLIGVNPSSALLAFLQNYLEDLCASRRYRLASLAYLISATLAGCAGPHRERLTHIAPIFELDFWRLLEHLPGEIIEDWSHLALWNGLRAQKEETKEKEMDGQSLSRRHLLKDVLNHWSQSSGTHNDQYAALMDWLTESDWLTEIRVLKAKDVPALPADQWLPMTVNSEYLPLLESFYRVEEGGTWTNAYGARLIFRLVNAERQVREVRLRVWSRSTEELGARQLTITEIRSGAKIQIGLTTEWGMLETRLSLERTPQPDFYSIALVVDKAYNPARLGVAQDARDLGVYLSEICIVTDASVASSAEAPQPPLPFANP